MVEGEDLALALSEKRKKIDFFFLYLINLICFPFQGWNDVSFHGSNQIPTPNIDALAYNGIILNKFYTQQTCTPSRAALLTGNYPMRSGYQGHPLKAGENRTLDMPIMPEHFKNLGYKTYLVGKWHLGHPYKRSLPTSKGFDYHFGHYNGYIGYFDKTITQDVCYYFL